MIALEVKRASDRRESPGAVKRRHISTLRQPLTSRPITRTVAIVGSSHIRSRSGRRGRPARARNGGEA